MSGDTAGILSRILQAESTRYDLIFTLFLLLVVGTFLALTPQYSSDGQLFPLVIGIPTFVLLLGLLALILSSRSRKFADKFTAGDLFGVDELGDIEESESNIEQTTNLIEQRKRVIAISTWILVLGLCVLLVGFLAGILVFMIAFYRIHAEETVSRTLLYSLLTWIVIIIVFVYALNVPFYTGVLDITIPVINP